MGFGYEKSLKLTKNCTLLHNSQWKNRQITHAFDWFKGNICNLISDSKIQFSIGSAVVQQNVCKRKTSQNWLSIMVKIYGKHEIASKTHRWKSTFQAFLSILRFNAVAREMLFCQIWAIFDNIQLWELLETKASFPQKYT